MWRRHPFRPPQGQSNGSGSIKWGSIKWVIHHSRAGNRGARPEGENPHFPHAILNQHIHIRHQRESPHQGQLPAQGGLQHGKREPLKLRRDEQPVCSIDLLCHQAASRCSSCGAPMGVRELIQRPGAYLSPLAVRSRSHFPVHEEPQQSPSS